jgi:hypothetical protein
VKTAKTAIASETLWNAELNLSSFDQRPITKIAVIAEAVHDLLV